MVVSRKAEEADGYHAGEVEFPGVNQFRLDKAVSGPFNKYFLQALAFFILLYIMRIILINDIKD